MTDLIDTTEMYLRTILELEEENIIPLRARISERLGHSGPTVSQTISRMERDGLVVVEGEDLTLIGTAEAPLTGYHADEIIDEKDLPLLYAGYSPCYRKEAGTWRPQAARQWPKLHAFERL